MRANIYKSYSAIDRESKSNPVYSVSSPVTPFYDEIKVEIPFESWTTVSGEIGVVLDGADHLIKDVPVNCGDAPALKWYAKGRTNCKVLKIVK